MGISPRFCEKFLFGHVTTAIVLSQLLSALCYCIPPSLSGHGALTLNRSSSFVPVCTLPVTRLHRVIPSLSLRGGCDDNEIPVGMSSEEVEGEGTIKPGPGVKIQEGIVDKIKKSGDEVKCFVCASVCTNCWYNYFGCRMKRSKTKKYNVGRRNMKMKYSNMSRWFLPNRSSVFFVDSFCGFGQEDKEMWKQIEKIESLVIPTLEEVVRCALPQFVICNLPPHR